MIHRFLHRQTPVSLAEIRAAYEAVEELALHATVKRKKGQNELSEGRPPKRRRGAVDEASRVANEELLRPLFFNRGTTKVDMILDDEDT